MLDIQTDPCGLSVESIIKSATTTFGRTKRPSIYAVAPGSNGRTPQRNAAIVQATKMLDDVRLKRKPMRVRGNNDKYPPRIVVTVRSPSSFVMTNIPRRPNLKLRYPTATPIIRNTRTSHLWPRYNAGANHGFMSMFILPPSGNQKSLALLKLGPFLFGLAASQRFCYITVDHNWPDRPSPNSELVPSCS